MPVKKGTRKAPDTLVSGATAVLITGTAISPSSDQRLVVLPLSCSFGLLLTLYAGLLVVFSLTDFLLDARLCAASLETTQSAVQSLILFYDNARHFFYPPFSPFPMENSPASHETY